MLFLVVCATIANCDDYEDIADWGDTHLDFLRRFSDFHHGVPCADWPRALMNRVDSELFKACFRAWVAASFPDRLDLVATDARPQAPPQNGRLGPQYLADILGAATH